MPSSSDNKYIFNIIQFTGGLKCVRTLLKMLGGNSPGKNIHKTFVFICALEVPWETPHLTVDHPCRLFGSSYCPVKPDKLIFVKHFWNFGALINYFLVLLGYSNESREIEIDNWKRNYFNFSLWVTAQSWYCDFSHPIIEKPWVKLFWKEIGSSWR